MMIRVIGAVMILLGCGGFGFVISRNVKNEIVALQNFLLATEYMICELRYRMTPLPSLCYATSQVTKGAVSNIFASLGKKLESQTSPSVSSCMDAVLKEQQVHTDNMTKLFQSLGQRLGIFDLDGQMEVLSSLRSEGAGILKNCQERQTVQLRNCKTIALCAGAAIVILMI